ncbi:FAD4L1 [Symbiodinium necroappetens]|uniref:FAD4L1 protein n=1 Tax=Symbiodinium necroappetens TaxID=1628268 RepID=A0A813C464_9DINO|nr:FAD4L1 [Symbiodinium necroappetens]
MAAVLPSAAGRVQAVAPARQGPAHASVRSRVSEKEVVLLSSVAAGLSLSTWRRSGRCSRTSVLLTRRISPRQIARDEADGAYFKPLVDGDVLSASDPQRLVVAVMMVLLSAGLLRVASLLGPLSWQASVCCLLALVLGVEFADFGTGVYHFSVDNYGSAETPIVGSQIEAFQGHHEEPWTITYRDFCNNCFPTCLATMPFLIAFEVFCSQPYILLWAVVACAGIAFCQEFHKWSHTLRSQCHPFVNWLQDVGILVHRKAHLRHHKAPYETNYCIVTGHMNPLLDRFWLVQFAGMLAYACFCLKDVSPWLAVCLIAAGKRLVVLFRLYLNGRMKGYLVEEAKGMEAMFLVEQRGQGPAPKSLPKAMQVETDLLDTVEKGHEASATDWATGVGSKDWRVFQSSSCELDAKSYAIATCAKKTA